MSRIKIKFQNIDTKSKQFQKSLKNLLFLEHIIKLFHTYDKSATVKGCKKIDGHYALTLQLGNHTVYQKLKSEFTFDLKSEVIYCKKIFDDKWLKSYFENISHKKPPSYTDIISNATVKTRGVKGLN
jgi:hypothetical protein